MSALVAEVGNFTESNTTLVKPSVLLHPPIESEFSFI